MHRPKEKRERALGERLMLKGERCASPKCAAVRKPYKPGVHGPKKRRKALSEFGRQLQEKQKFKLSYGIDDRTLRSLFERAEKKTGSTAAGLLEFLERRMDNVIFRMGFANSRLRARQLLVHGHIFVNGRRTRSPGMVVKAGDKIAFRPESKNIRLAKDLAETLKKYEAPPWILLDKEKIEGEILSLPQDTPPPFEINLLVESFSK
ncbi:MAG: 30S ribosomal protein S4 [Patescibacteria group bacterium]